MEPDSTYVHNTPTMASIGDEMLRKNYASAHSPHSWQVPQQKVSDRSNTPSDGYMQSLMRNIAKVILIKLEPVTTRCRME